MCPSAWGLNLGLFLALAWFPWEETLHILVCYRQQKAIGDFRCVMGRGKSSSALLLTIGESQGDHALSLVKCLRSECEYRPYSYRHSSRGMHKRICWNWENSWDCWKLNAFKLNVNFPMVYAKNILFKKKIIMKVYIATSWALM